MPRVEAWTLPPRRHADPIVPAVGAAFAAFGFFWGSWAVAAADVKATLHLGTAGFGAFWSAALVGAAVGNAAGGVLTERWGGRRLLSTTLAVWALTVAATAVVPGRWALAATLGAGLMAGGLLDVAMNVVATAAFANRPGGLVRFHGLFNVGAAFGAALTGLAIAGHHGWRLVWLAVAPLDLGIAWLAQRSDIPVAAAGGRLPLTRAISVLREERLVPLATVFALGAMVEGGIELWGVLYLRTRLASGLLVGASGAVAGYLVAASTRFIAGPRAGAAGAPFGIALGAGVAAGGATLMALSTSPAAAACGLALAAGGVSLCWPLLMSLAGAGRRRPGAAVGSVSAVGYLGIVLGPALVGWVATAGGMRSGLGFIAAASLLVALSPLVPSIGRRGVTASSPGSSLMPSPSPGPERS